MTELNRALTQTEPVSVSTDEDWQSFIDGVQRAQYVAIREGECPRFDLVAAAIHLRDSRPVPAPVGEEEPCLQWTENRPPGTDNCPYDHCIAGTPFGRFLITWKSWKKYDSPTVDETPWGDWWQAFGSVDKAKDACKREYVKRLLACRADNSTDMLERQAAPAPVAMSERLPGAKDCDAEGRVWLYRPQTPILNPYWDLVKLDYIDIDPVMPTHWLPAHALPLPSVEVE